MNSNSCPTTAFTRSTGFLRIISQFLESLGFDVGIAAHLPINLPETFFTDISDETDCDKALTVNF